MKKLFLPLLLITSIYGYSQVGIGTSNPEATLDIVATDANGNLTTPEGVLIPRVSRLRAQSMNNVKESTLIYVTNVSDGSLTGTAALMNEIGFYYFSETQNRWIKLNSSSGGGTSYTYENGITENTGIVKLGGTLIEPTSLITSSQNTLALRGLQGGSNSDNILMVNSSNEVVRRMSTADIGGTSRNVGDVLISSGNNPPRWTSLAASGVATVAGLLRFLPSGNNTSYLSNDLGSNIRIVRWDDTESINSSVINYSALDNSFTAMQDGYYEFSINLVVRGGYNGEVRLGLSKPLPFLTSASNSTFAFLNQPTVSVGSNQPITLYCNGTIYLNSGQKVWVLTRFINPASNTLNVEAINYDRTLTSSVSIKFFSN